MHLEKGCRVGAMKKQHVLVLGAGGNVSRHSIPKLVAAGHSVTALVRDPEHVQKLVDEGATAIVRDLTTISTGDWARLLSPFDVVVWSAGAGGGSAELTYAVDRDAALAMIDALEELGDAAPFTVMVSYAGASEATTEDDGGSWYAYVESKKAVDKRLLGSNLPYQILGPTALTDDAPTGITVLDGDMNPASETPRELVADVIVESVGRGEAFDHNPLDFENGTGDVADV